MLKSLLELIERPLIKWLGFWHGNSTAFEQFRYYRCEGCRKLVTWKTIGKGGCGCGLSIKIRPAVLSWKDKIRCVVAPWSV